LTETILASSPSPTVLVFGASGYVGSNLVPRLARECVRLRACARNRKVLEARAWPGVELAEADALAPETLSAALAGVDVAYYLVHSMAAGEDFGRLDLEAADNFAAASARAGVKRIVYLGGLVPSGADSEHIVSRRDTGERLRAGPVPVTEIRAGIIVGPGSAAFEVMRDLVLHLPLMVTPRWVRAKSPPIALDNLLEYLVRIAFVPEAAGRIYDAGGPEVLSYQDMMRCLADVAGKRQPLIIPVPVLSPRLSSYWLGLITAVPASVARALIGGLKHDFAADDAALRRLVPQRLLAFREAVEAAFVAELAHTGRRALDRGRLLDARVPARPRLLCEEGGRQRRRGRAGGGGVAPGDLDRRRQPLLLHERPVVAARAHRLVRRRAGVHSRAATSDRAAHRRRHRLLDGGRP
jgi:uncharacterized protein YbjT (DUF2867 family)